MQPHTDQIMRATLRLSRRSVLQLSGMSLLATTLPAPRRQTAVAAKAAVRPRYPFPQHTVYTPGTIRPNHRTQAQLDQAVKNFYKLWRKRYLRSGCGRGRYYVFPEGEGGGRDDNSISISEGHGYGMVIMALMAGYEPKAQTIFDGMVDFFRDHPSAINPNLMAWNQLKGCGNAADADSATDGDMDIAYALLLADQQWGSNGRINYRAAAHQLIEAGLFASVVHPITHHLTLGDWASPAAPKLYQATRPSDFMVNHLRAYQAATGNPDWERVLDTCYSLIDRMQTLYSPVTGLLPDFIQEVNRQPRPAVGTLLEDETDGAFYYNACRTPWRIGTDYLLAGDARAYRAVNKLTTWLKQTTAGDPRRLRAGYWLDGRDVADNNYLAVAFLAPLGVGAMVDAAHQSWLNAIWDLTSRQGLNATDYYGNTLKLLSMIVMSGNWWSPATVDRQRGDKTAATTAAEAAATDFEPIEADAITAASGAAHAAHAVYLPWITR